MKFTLVRPECIDWEALYIDGKLAAEGHSLSADRVLERISKHMDCEIEYIGITDDVAEMGMPTLLSELEV